MKLLLDENLPIKLKQSFSSEYGVFTVKEMGWSGKKNGELLGLMASSGFHLLVTIDKNLLHQQNLSQHGISVVLLSVLDNKLSTLIPFIEKLELRVSLPIEEVVIEINL